MHGQDNLQWDDLKCLNISLRACWIFPLLLLGPCCWSQSRSKRKGKGGQRIPWRWLTAVISCGWIARELPSKTLSANQPTTSYSPHSRSSWCWFSCILLCLRHSGQWSSSSAHISDLSTRAQSSQNCQSTSRSAGRRETLLGSKALSSLHSGSGHWFYKLPEKEREWGRKGKQTHITREVVITFWHQNY